PLPNRDLPSWPRSTKHHACFSNRRQPDDPPTTSPRGLAPRTAALPCRLAAHAAALPGSSTVDCLPKRLPPPCRLSTRASVRFTPSTPWCIRRWVRLDFYLESKYKTIWPLNEPSQPDPNTSFQRTAKMPVIVKH
ncbi:hypothetical protein EJB05_26107, partial [Eragrostis curvula]